MFGLHVKEEHFGQKTTVLGYDTFTWCIFLCGIQVCVWGAAKH